MSAPPSKPSSEATTYIVAITCEQMKKAEDYLQEFVLAWLDTAINDDKTAFDVSLGLLRTIQQVITFNDVQKCYDYLRSTTNKRGFLVLSCKIDDQLLNDFIALPQLEYIYSFGKESILKKEHSKLVEITSIQALYSRLSQDARYCSEEDEDTDFATLKSETTVNSIQDLEGDARVFVFYQLLIEILLQLPKTSELWEQFITFCMDKTNDNPAQQNIFRELIKNYNPNEAISWYTNPCFFHKLLNRTCRLGNIQDMFKLAFYMIDLNAQLKSIHNEYFDCYKDRIEIYRGRPMSRMEFEKLKGSIGDLVVTKSFLSGTTEKDVALVYSGVGTQKPDFVPAVLYMIIDKQRNETKPFAYTRYYSKVRADDEILISIGTIFRIVSTNDKNGVHEFMLVRGDTEKEAESQMHEAFRDQMKTNKTFFHSESSSTDIDECCKQVLEVLNSPEKQRAQSSEQQIQEKMVEKTNTESKPIAAASVIPLIQSYRNHKRLLREVDKLKKEVKELFILEIAPSLDDESDSIDNNPKWLDSQGNIIIQGRILPQSEPYCQRSFRITFTLPHYYPFEPPKVRFEDFVYHPSISTNGHICNPVSDKYQGYNPAVTLSDIIRSVEKRVSNLDETLVGNEEAYKQYRKDRDEFNRIALHYIHLYGHPRT